MTTAALRDVAEPIARDSGVTLLERLVLWGTIASLAVLVLYPLGMILLRSVQSEDLTALTLENYATVLATPRLLQLLWNSILIATGATLLSVLFGVSLAWINARTNTPGARTLANLNLIPFFTPSFVGAFAWTILASQKTGLINQWAAALGLPVPLVNIFSPGGIIWVLALYETPLVYLFVANAFRKMDPALEEAARMSGSGILETTFRVTLPLTLPSVMAAALLIFVTVLGSFEVPLVLGLPARFHVLTTELYAITSEYPARYDLAATLCTILLVATAIGLFVQRKFLLRRSYATVTGKAYRPYRIDIGRGRYLALAWNFLYLAVAVLLPLFALGVASLDRIWTGVIRPHEFTLANYTYLWTEFELGREAVFNTMVLSFSAATICTALGAITAYLIFRSKLRGRGFLDLLSGLPLAVPAAILAVGVAIAWIKSPLYGTLWIILIGYIAKFTVYAQRSVAATLLSISAELDECSRVCGASWGQTLRDVVFPLLRPGIVGGWLLLFIIFLRELGISLFLYGVGTQTVSIAIYVLSLESPTRTAAACILQTAAILVMVVFLRKLTRDDELTL
ncbi:MAG: iron ABC transporter permease [Variibacter sp.]|nr:iron ABC transporter permease [Variibacter sp.]